MKTFKEPNIKKKILYSLIGLIIISLGVFIFYQSYALYEENKDFNVINGVVEDPGDLYFAYYVNNTITRDVPTKDSGLTLDTTKSSCTSGVNVSWDDDNWHAILDYSNYQKDSTTRTKCTLYFKNKPVIATTLLNNLVSGANKSSTDVYTVPDKTSDSCTYTLAYDGTDDNNLRYVGKNPCNYVTFNGETAGWRIIGILNTPEGQRLKLVRTYSISHLAWDYTSAGRYENNWTTSSLQELLNNGAYYNRTIGQYYNDSSTASTVDFSDNGLTEESKELIDTITWNLGGTSSYTSSSNGLVSHWYTYERGNTVYSGRPTTWQGKVGLIYPSDYGYATSGNTNTDRTTCLNSILGNWIFFSDCYKNDWIISKSSTTLWTMTPYKGYSDSVISVRTDGPVQKDVTNNWKYSVHPTIYLKSTAVILSGEGTLEKPYEIG